MIIVWILAALIAVVGLAAIALAAAGAGVPEKHVAASAVRLKASPREVWGVVSDLSGWTTWAPGVTKVEALPQRNGHDVWLVRAGRQVMPIEIERVEFPRRFVTLIDDPKLPYGGRWTWEIGPDGARGSPRPRRHGRPYRRGCLSRS